MSEINQLKNELLSHVAMPHGLSPAAIPANVALVAMDGLVGDRTTPERATSSRRARHVRDAQRDTEAPLFAIKLRQTTKLGVWLPDRWSVEAGWIDARAAARGCSAAPQEDAAKRHRVEIGHADRTTLSEEAPRASRRRHTGSVNPASLGAYLSVDEACRYLGIGRTKLYSVFAAGDLAGKKLGRRTLIERSELERYAQTLPAMGCRTLDHPTGVRPKPMGGHGSNSVMPSAAALGERGVGRAVR